VSFLVRPTCLLACWDCGIRLIFESGLDSWEERSRGVYIQYTPSIHNKRLPFHYCSAHSVGPRAEATLQQK
jgi:hypothetical protein